MEDTNLQGGIKEKNGVCNNTIAAATSKGSSKVGIVILKKTNWRQQSKASRDNLCTDLLWLSLKLYNQILDVSKYLVFGAVPIHL